MAAQRIVTNYWAKPIPLREFDWSATFDDYEGPDSDGIGGGLIGFGTTEAAAILDLLDQNDDTYERVVGCGTCGTEGQLIHWSGGMDQYGSPNEWTETCPRCEGTCDEIIKTQPITMEDLAKC